MMRREYSAMYSASNVELPALHIARQTGIGLSRQLARGNRAHLFDRVEHDRGTDTAVETDDVGAPFIQLAVNASEWLRTQCCRRSESSSAPQSQVTQFLDCLDGLMKFRSV